jgi:hypothetical protein
MACKRTVGDAEKTMADNGCSVVASQIQIIVPIEAKKDEQNYLSCQPETKKSNKHRPYGYWRSFDNVRAALEPYISRLGRMPTKAELDSAGEKSLAVIILRHGGYGEVARRLGVQSASEKKRLSRRSKNNSLPLKKSNKGTQVKKRRPNGYWDDFHNVETELKAFVAEYGIDGVMPRPADLYSAGQSRLADEIRQHGGYEFFAFWLGWRIFPPFSRRKRIRQVCGLP